MRIVSLARSLALSIGLILTAISPAAPVRAQAAPTFVVNSPADIGVISGALDNGVCETVAGNGVCTLRAAIIKANHYPDGGVTILLPALPDGGAYKLTIPISSSTGENDGDLNISERMTIQGEGSSRTFIDAGGNGTRIFALYETGPVRISGVTLRNGQELDGDGGAIFAVYTTLILDDVHITGSTAGRDGGGIRILNADLQLSNSRVDNNTGVNGGGISCFDCSIKISRSVISDNEASADGGGLYLLGLGANSYIDSSLIHSNTSASDGGGLSFTAIGKLGIVNSSIIGNRAAFNGGGIFYTDSGTAYTTALRLDNVTVADNEANQANQNYQGGGIYNDDPLTLRVNNSIITRNSRPNNGGTLLLPSDCQGTITSEGNNLITDVPDGECTIDGPYSTANPKLALALGQNGGPTATLALLPGSPAIDAGDPTGCTGWDGAVLRKDQRGYPRPVVGCDLGAYEAARQMYLPLIDR